MESGYEPIAEEIIRLLWYSPDHNFNWYILSKDKLKLSEISLQEFNTIKPLIKQDLINEGFIEKTPLTTLDSYRLTEKGRSFISFHETRRLEEVDKKQKAIEDIPKRKWYYYDVLKIVFTAAVTFFLTKGCSESSNQQQQIRQSPDSAAKKY